jgi:hypothetical protein
MLLKVKGSKRRLKKNCIMSTFMMHISYHVLLVEPTKQDRKVGACTPCVTRVVDAGLLVGKQEGSMPIASRAH